MATGKVRRFGYRIDKAQPAWEPANWIELSEEADQIEQISKLTGDDFDFSEPCTIRKRAELRDGCIAPSSRGLAGQHLKLQDERCRPPERDTRLSERAAFHRAGRHSQRRGAVALHVLSRPTQEREAGSRRPVPGFRCRFGEHRFTAESSRLQVPSSVCVRRRRARFSGWPFWGIDSGLSIEHRLDVPPFFIAFLGALRK